MNCEATTSLRVGTTKPVSPQYPGGSASATTPWPCNWSLVEANNVLEIFVPSCSASGMSQHVPGRAIKTSARLNRSDKVRPSRSHTCRRVECLNMCLLRNWCWLSRTRWQLSRLARAMLLSARRCESIQHATSATVQTCRRGNHDGLSASSRRSLWSRQTVWCLQDTPRVTD